VCLSAPSMGGERKGTEMGREGTEFDEGTSVFRRGGVRTMEEKVKKGGEGVMAK